ncbi:hypothetical protein [Antribacter gilvus]|uniref:hypothetical protein n=1 Tax=Antribacter gilvus TaxID=2304675 RepID=UPI000F7AC12B|nr:hypothetical protein [Antribacter gilvus]
MNDSFVEQVRSEAFAAVPPSNLDLDQVLRSSRRKAALHRGAIGLVTACAVGSVGLGAAVSLPGVLPGLPGLAEGALVGSSAGPGLLSGMIGTELVRTTQAAPGIRQVAESASYRVDDNTVVVDLGLDAWADHETFLLELSFADVGGQPRITEKRVIAGDASDLQALARGEQAGTEVWRGRGNVEISRPDGRGVVMVGQPMPLGPGYSLNEHFLVLDQPVPAADGTTTRAVQVDDFIVFDAPPEALYAVELEGVAPARPRGMLVVSAGSDPHDYSWGTSSCDVEPGCAVTYDPATRQVTPTPPRTVDETVTQLIAMTEDGSETSRVNAMRLCMTQRGSAWEVTSWEVVSPIPPDGVDAGTWYACLLDVTGPESVITHERVAAD